MDISAHKLHANKFRDPFMQPHKISSQNKTSGYGLYIWGLVTERRYFYARWRPSRSCSCSRNWQTRVNHCVSRLINCDILLITQEGFANRSPSLWQWNSLSDTLLAADFHLSRQWETSFVDEQTSVADGRPWAAVRCQVTQMHCIAIWQDLWEKKIKSKS